MATELIRERNWFVSPTDCAAFYSHCDIAACIHTADNGFLAVSYGETCYNMSKLGFTPKGFGHTSNNAWAFCFYDKTTDDIFWVHVSEILYRQWNIEMEKIVNL